MAHEITIEALKAWITELQKDNEYSAGSLETKIQEITKIQNNIAARKARIAEYETTIKILTADNYNGART